MFEGIDLLHLRENGVLGGLLKTLVHHEYTTQEHVTAAIQKGKRCSRTNWVVFSV